MTTVPLATESEAVDQDLALMLGQIVEDISRDGFAFRAGNEMRSVLQRQGLDAWSAFASSWDDLGPDVYMADGGRYRRRRFAAFGVSGGAFTRKPHQPHYQAVITILGTAASSAGLRQWRIAFPPTGSRETS
jgi:hypothetical protein